jgi:hypothetical protein
MNQAVVDYPKATIFVKKSIKAMEGFVREVSIFVPRPKGRVPRLVELKGDFVWS